jgi:3-hydroxyisobutyrate dehydrogenase
LSTGQPRRIWQLYERQIYKKGELIMKLGWIGIGVMGLQMAGHLQNEGHELYVFNRTKSKAEALLEKGAVWCADPAEVSADAEIVFTMVGYPSDVKETYLGENGILHDNARCRVIVDMTTSEPKLAARIAKVAARQNIKALDAPVSGGDIGAKNGTLAIMVGGSRSAFEEVFPLFEIMGKNIALMGKAGAGQHTKMCNQILIAGTMIGTCESLLYASSVGLDQQKIIDIIGKGAAGSWSINNLGPRIAKGDYAPGFYVDHFIKDMGIALKESAALKLSMPGLALVHQLYVALQAHGQGKNGTQALINALKALNGQSK